MPSSASIEWPPAIVAWPFSTHISISFSFPPCHTSKFTSASSRDKALMSSKGPVSGSCLSMSYIRTSSRRIAATSDTNWCDTQSRFITFKVSCCFGLGGTSRSHFASVRLTKVSRVRKSITSTCSKPMSCQTTRAPPLNFLLRCHNIFMSICKGMKTLLLWEQKTSDCQRKFPEKKSEPENPIKKPDIWNPIRTETLKYMPALFVWFLWFAIDSLVRIVKGVEAHSRARHHRCSHSIPLPPPALASQPYQIQLPFPFCWHHPKCSRSELSTKREPKHKRCFWE